MLHLTFIYLFGIPTTGILVVDSGAFYRFLSVASIFVIVARGLWAKRIHLEDTKK